MDMTCAVTSYELMLANHLSRRGRDPESHARAGSAIAASGSIVTYGQVQRDRQSEDGVAL
jgi:hypothetical protein